jgi:glucose/mannose-6-phosphate isomerase
VLEHTAAAPPTGADIRAAAHACDTVANDRGGSLASELGEALAATTTWVYGHGPLSAVARRFKSQLNENAKSTACFGELPEVDHNEIVGWAGTTRTGGRHAAIHLADPDDPATVRASIVATPRLIDDDATLHRVLTGQGQTRTARAFWLLSLLDHASVYTAKAAGVDPYEIDRITELKRALAAAQ